MFITPKYKSTQNHKLGEKTTDPVNFRSSDVKSMSKFKNGFLDLLMANDQNDQQGKLRHSSFKFDTFGKQPLDQRNKS